MKKCYALKGKGLTVLSDYIYQTEWKDKKPHILLGQALRDMGYKECDPLEDTTLVLLTDVGIIAHNKTHLEALGEWTDQANTVFSPEVEEFACDCNSKD